MALSALGVGFGRTGTLSLKLALEALGFAPCYHMVELAQQRAHTDTWLRAARGENVDWERLFEGYSAAVDWPAAAFWREILEAHPDARVIVTVRDATDWYSSFRETILDKMQGPAPPTALAIRAIYDVTKEVVIDKTFGGRASDEQHAIKVFESHNRDVLASISPERFLVWNPSAGWEPLCAFLRVPVPPIPFPHVNRRASFQRQYADLRERAADQKSWPTS